jgi:bifunctional ADP-heptose synthase (sugar kinase/adenylyltransferase)
LALGLADAGLGVTLVGFVGDDELAEAIERPLQTAGVVADLLHIKQWQTFTDTALDSLATAEDALDAQGRRRRRHKDERALPIDGMSEYEAHLQNRAERYMRNAVAVVLVDYDLGSLAEPRALVFVANQLGIPCVAALGSQRRLDLYAKADHRLNLSGLDLLDAAANIVSSLPSAMAPSS